MHLYVLSRLSNKTMRVVGLPVGDEPPAAAAQRGEDFRAAVPDMCFGAPSVISKGHTDAMELISLLKTEMFLYARHQDIAGTVVFLCSGLGRYINGQTIRVDGGMSSTNRLW
eukprot:SAG31_NODE_1953_length_6829_cov_6.548886_3_plen_112_part_00